MAITPSVGRRVLMPPASPQASFVEIRRIGLYPESIVFAFLYQYIECFLETANAVYKSCFLRFLQQIQVERKDIEAISALFQTAEDSAILASEDFRLRIQAVVQLALVHLDLRIENDYQVIESLETLADALECRGQILYFEPSKTTYAELQRIEFGRKGPEIVAIAVKSKLYLLYNTLAKESFFVPTCGCLSLKYRIFADLQRAAQNYAKTVDELVALNVQCQICGKPYTKRDLQRLYFECECFAFQTTTKNCTHDSEWGIACMLCEFPMCGLCCAAQALTAKGPLCARCQAPYDEQIRGALSVHNYQWAEQYLNISGINRQFEQKQTEIRKSNLRASTDTDSRQRKSSMPLLLPSNMQISKSRMCLGCSSEVKYSLCSAGCCCLFCAVSNIYSSTDLQKMCLYCLQSASTFLDLDGDCSFCKRNVRYSDLAFMCLRCGYQICEFCFLRKEGQISQCSKGQIPHKLNIGAKRKFLQLKFSRVGLF